MKKVYATFALLCVLPFAAFSEEAQSSKESTFYSVFVNIVPDNFKFPLIGFFNYARGSQSWPQIGFINMNEKDLSSLQVGFVNTIGGNFSGYQSGFVNIVGGDFSGVQGGIVSTVGGNFSGVQAGFMNTVRTNFAGFQSSLMNTVGGDFSGFQFGIANIVGGGFSGFQAGYVNITAQKFRGLQLGLVNYAGSIDGIPLGLVSIVRDGGYQAIEYSFSEFFPINIGIKTGIEKVYTTLFLAYDPNDVYDPNAVFITEGIFIPGTGIGSILRLSNTFYFNPELTIVYQHWQRILSFVPYFGCNIGNFSIVAGPSVSWVRSETGDATREPSFSIAQHTFNEKNRLVLAARAGVRYRF
jgi:hypothetical protein